MQGVRFLWQRAMDGRAGGDNSGGLGSLNALADGDKVWVQMIGFSMFRGWGLGLLVACGRRWRPWRYGVGFQV